MTLRSLKSNPVLVRSAQLVPRPAAAIDAHLKEYLQNPIATVAVFEFRSQPVSVLGAVNTSGIHQIRGSKRLKVYGARMALQWTLNGSDASQEKLAAKLADHEERIHALESQFLLVLECEKVMS